MAGAVRSDIPKTPYAVGPILKLRDAFASELVYRFGQIAITMSDLPDLFDLTRELFPKSVRDEFLRESVKYLLGKTLSPEFCKEFAWRLAGNLPHLRRGAVVGPWMAPGAAEWVPLQITAAWPAPRRHDKPHTRLGLRVLAGGPAGMYFTKHLSNGQLSLAARHFGFSRSSGQFPYREPSELVLLRFYALLDPMRTKGLEPNFKEMDCPTGCLKHNRLILNRRFRVDPCPHRYAHRCSQCPVGYNNCHGATHREDFAVRFCTGCGKDAYFDPETGADVCVECWAKQQTARKA